MDVSDVYVCVWGGGRAYGPRVERADWLGLTTSYSLPHEDVMKMRRFAEELKALFTIPWYTI